MYISKNDLIKRLVKLTGKDRREFLRETLDSLTRLYEVYLVSGERRYINVSYKDKETVKRLGAVYDGEKEKWFIPPGVDSKLFGEWL